MKQDLTRIFQPGQVLCREGEAGKELYFIQEGRVKVSRMIHGKEVILAELGSNSIVGEMAVIDQGPRSASVVALEPTKVMAMSPQKLNTIFRTAPDIAVTIIKLLSTKLREANNQISRGFTLNNWVFWRRSVYLMTLLAAVGDPRAENVRMPEPEAKTNMSVGLGLSFPEVEQVMQRMLSAGLLQQSGNGEITFSLNDMNMFYTFLDRYFGSGHHEEAMEEDTFMVASQLVELTKKHYGQIELAVSTFKRATLLDFIASSPRVFPKNSADMKKKLINEQLIQLERLGFVNGAPEDEEDAVTLDLTGLAQRVQEQEYIQSCIERYNILTAWQ